MTLHLRVWAILGSCLLSTAGICQQRSSTAWPAVAASGPEPLDEVISIARTQPIPMQKAPQGCAVKHMERYCRTDGRPIRSFNVLEQKTSALSSMSEPRIEAGCLVVEMMLAVAMAKKPPDMCEGGEARASLKISVSAR